MDIYSLINSLFLLLVGHFQYVSHLLWIIMAAGVVSLAPGILYPHPMLSTHGQIIRSMEINFVLGALWAYRE